MKAGDMHVLRNPWGYSDDRIREARLNAAAEIDRLRAERDYACAVIDSLACEAEKLVPPCTSDEIWHAVVYMRVKARSVLADLKYEPLAKSVTESEQSGDKANPADAPPFDRTTILRWAALSGVYGEMDPRNDRARMVEVACIAFAMRCYEAGFLAAKASTEINTPKSVDTPK